MFLLKKGISHQLIVPSLTNLKCYHSSPLQIIYDVRNKLLKVTSAKLHEKTVAWLHALVLGEDEALDDEIIQLFQRRSEEHTSELQSRGQLVCRLLLEKKDPTRCTQGWHRRASCSIK